MREGNAPRTGEVINVNSFKKRFWHEKERALKGDLATATVTMSTEFTNPLRKFKLVFLGEQSGTLPSPRSTLPHTHAVRPSCLT